MFCPNCGTAVVGSPKFCAKCGASLDTSGTTAAPLGGARPATLAPEAPEAPYSGFWRRFGALIVDDIIVTVGFYAVVFVVAAAIAATAGKSAGTGASAGVGAREVIIIMLVAGVVLAPWLYYAGMESSSIQGTLGKLVAGIKVTDLEGKRVSFGRATGRYFAHILSGITLGVGYAMVVFTSHRQALHDMIAGTLIVRREFSQEAIEAAPPAPRVSPILATLAVIGVMLCGPFGIGVLAATAIPAYQDYTIRAQVTEGLNAASSYKSPVVEAMAQGRQLATINSEELRLPDGRSKYIHSIRVVSGVIEITYSESANKLISGKTVLLIPAIGEGGQQVEWVCGHHGAPYGFAAMAGMDDYTTVPERYLPTLCKSGG